MADPVFDGINPFNGHQIDKGCLFGFYKSDKPHKNRKRSTIDLSTLPNDIKEISRFCFINNKRIKRYVSNKSLRAIGNNAFTNSSLEEVIIKDSIEYIGIECFAYCSDLRSVYIDSECVNIEDYAFAYCPNLKRVTLKGYANIMPNAFVGCPNLEEIHIENCSLKYIKDLILPDGIKIYAKVNSNYYHWCIKNNIQMISED